MTMFGIVEIMGHRTRAGAISDAQMGGATLLRIEHPTRADHTGLEPLAEFYAPAAIFSIQPCSEEEATKVAGWAWAEAVQRPALGPAFDDVMDDEDDLVCTCVGDHEPGCQLAEEPF
jgi:hypothetical protein